MNEHIDDTCFESAVANGSRSELFRVIKDNVDRVFWSCVKSGLSRVAAARSALTKTAKRFSAPEEDMVELLCGLGYSAEGLIPNRTGGYREPYLYNKGALGKGETYFARLPDVVEYMVKDEALMKGLLSGELAYVDGHVVVNSEKYLFAGKKGEFRLTEYALSHMDECAVKFAYEIASDAGSETRGPYMERELMTAKELRKGLKICRSVFSLSDGVCADKKAFEIANETIVQIADMIRGKTIGETLRIIIHDIMDCSLWKLSADTGISNSTLSRYMVGTLEPKIGRIIAICVYFHLPPQLSNLVLENMGRLRRNGCEDSVMYLGILDSFWTWGDVLALNKMLVMLGMEPMSDT
ncbi:MAG: helix-turn-helix domain-containing protein [Clostridia bacterium]|nr:helix-turn-helix domain-containing protein [Clostridia bacterium]